ncbi:MBL fold metallo-hydrolase [Cohnella suwonensis]|uniref:MBL fold metallo-hydrolase n=1 Tax=Cohnella suwonensis TaxID=696072 RepID=A0ABW0LNY9_9BACL
MIITFLGTGDSMGTPRVYCECEVCEEARETGINRRLRSSLLLEDEGELPLLLDCGPDWREQMEKAGLRGVGRALLTHAHFDHIVGLPEWADACRWTEAPATIHAPREVTGDVLSRFPWLDRQFRFEANDEGTAYGGWRIAPWRVNHGKNGYSYAYRFDHAERGVSWAYCSDSIDLTEGQKAPLAGLSLLVLGTSFAEEPYPMDTRSVYDMKEGLALAEETRPGSVVFTHLSHDVDLRRSYGHPDHVTIAHTGLRLTI